MNVRCSLWILLAEHPSTITDHLVARTSAITGAAQRQPSSFQLVRFASRKAWTKTAALNQNKSLSCLRCDAGPDCPPTRAPRHVHPQRVKEAMVASRDFRWSFSIQFISAAAAPDGRGCGPCGRASCARGGDRCRSGGRDAARPEWPLRGNRRSSLVPRSAPLTTSNRLLLVFRKATYARFW